MSCQKQIFIVAIMILIAPIGVKLGSTQTSFEDLVANWKNAYSKANDKIYFQCIQYSPMNPDSHLHKTIRRNGMNYSQLIRYEKDSNKFANLASIRNSRYQAQLDLSDDGKWRVANMVTKYNSEWTTKNIDKGIIQMGLNPYSVLDLLEGGFYEIVESDFDTNSNAGKFGCKFDLDAALQSDIVERDQRFAQFATISFDLSIGPFPISYEMVVTSKDQSKNTNHEISLGGWLDINRNPLPLNIEDRIVLDDDRVAGLVFELSDVRPLNNTDREFFNLSHYGLPEPKRLEPSKGLPVWVNILLVGLVLVIGAAVAKKIMQSR